METPELKARLRHALACLNLLLECGAAGAALDEQRRHCGELRAMINAVCPDGEFYDPYDGNIVEKPV